MPQYKRLREDDLHVGSPMQWNAFDSGGRLLLRKGHVISSKNQLATLIKLGLFRAHIAGEENDAPGQAPPKLSPFDTLTLFQYRIKALLAEIHHPSGGHLPEQATHFAKDVQELYDKDPDAALGALHIDREGLYIHTHPIHTALLTELVAKHLNIPEAERVSLIAAALTANVGMLDLQAKLHDQKETLTARQQEEIWSHPEQGVTLLKNAGITDALWLDSVLHHHERMNGSGYPSGLSGDQVATGVRILSLADAYCAMVTSRAYRAELQAKVAMKEIFLQRGSAIDESLAHALIKELTIYPPGTFVRLVNGEIAVVIKRGPGATSPVVQSILGPRGTAYSAPRQHHCEDEQFKIKEMVAREKNLPVNLNKLWRYD